MSNEAILQGQYHCLCYFAFSSFQKLRILFMFLFKNKDYWNEDYFLPAV